MNLERAFESIRTGFGQSSPYAVPLMIGILLLIVLFLGAFAIHQHRYYFLGRWIYWKRRLSGEPISTDRSKHNLEIVIQLPYQQKPFRTRLVNLSPRGMFVRMDPPLLPGESFRFLLNLPKGQSLNAQAEVRWCQEKKTPFTPPGMGCRIYQISEADQNNLRKFLKASRQ